MLPYYEQVTKGTLRELLERNKEGMEVFSSLGLQWVCEGDYAVSHVVFKYRRGGAETGSDHVADTIGCQNEYETGNRGES